jgi:D-glycero-D-manno-heptose 1,7-bisphosphate phosphatase
VFLDRDGTINVKAPPGDYITAPGQVELLPGAAEAIRELNRAHIPVIVVTNQRGIALGRMTEADLAAVHARLAELLAAYGARIDQIHYCPHEEGVCACRKPGTLLLERARDELALPSLGGSWMIGDSSRDMLAGVAAGARTVLLGDSAEPLPEGVERAPSLGAAVERILS